MAIIIIIVTGKLNSCKAVIAFWGVFSVAYIVTNLVGKISCTHDHMYQYYIIQFQVNGVPFKFTLFIMPIKLYALQVNVRDTCTYDHW